MMTIPFFALAGGLVAVWRGHRMIALTCWIVTMAAILVFFRVHATSQLGLGL